MLKTSCLIQRLQVNYSPINLFVKQDAYLTAVFTTTYEEAPLYSHTCMIQTYLVVHLYQSCMNQFYTPPPVSISRPKKDRQLAGRGSRYSVDRRSPDYRNNHLHNRHRHEH